MLTKDEQKAQKDDVHNCSIDGAQKTDSHNYSLDDVLLGKRVKIARKEKRLTQEELASLCDCTPTHICNIILKKYKICMGSSRRCEIQGSRKLLPVFFTL